MTGAKELATSNVEKINQHIFTYCCDNLISLLNITENQHDPIDVGKELYLSTRTLPGYATLDWEHRQSILSIMDKIQRYSSDHTIKRPLNFLMLASPGSGKSYFVKSIAKAIKNVDVDTVVFNMANISSISDFTGAIDQVRNIKIQDKLPIIFLDEFDAKDDYIIYFIATVIRWRDTDRTSPSAGRKMHNHDGGKHRASY